MMKKITIVLLLLLGLTVLGYMQSPIDPHAVWYNNILFLLSPLIAVAGALYASRAYGLQGNIHGRSFLLIALGLAFLFIGEALFLYYEVILKVEAFPSIADVFYLLSYPFMLVGFLRETKSYATKVTGLDTLLLTIISLLLGFVVVYFGVFVAYQSDQSLLNNTIAMAYGVGDLFLLLVLLNTLVLIFDFKGGKLFPAWLAICIGMFLTLVADILFAIYNEPFDRGEWLYRQIDLLWVSGYLSIAYGCFMSGFIIKDIQQKILKKLKKS